MNLRDYYSTLYLQTHVLVDPWISKMASGFFWYGNEDHSELFLRRLNCPRPSLCEKCHLCVLLWRENICSNIAAKDRGETFISPAPHNKRFIPRRLVQKNYEVVRVLRDSKMLEEKMQYKNLSSGVAHFQKVTWYRKWCQFHLFSMLGTAEN